MTFQPVVPVGGLIGWKFLNRTIDAQINRMAQSVVNLRDTEYFRNEITKIETAEDLVNDRRLLRVALGAFGLQDDINNKAFIEKVLSEGVDQPSSLARRLSDNRYVRFSAAFGFGDASGVRINDAGFSDRIIENYNQSSFEVRIGETDDDMRLALYAKRKIAELSQSESSENAKWFQILADPPLRKVFEAGLGLPDSFGQINLDQQVRIMKDLSKIKFGLSSVADFGQTDFQTALVERFLINSQVSAINLSTSSQSTALMLLKGSMNPS